MIDQLQKLLGKPTKSLEQVMGMPDKLEELLGMSSKPQDAITSTK